MSTKYWITAMTEVAEESWHNSEETIHGGLSVKAVAEHMGCDLRSVRRYRRADGGIDRYYTLYIDGQRVKAKWYPHYVRVSDPWGEQ